MFIPRIFRRSSLQKPTAPGRRSTCARPAQLEPLESRIPLSAGLDFGVLPALNVPPPRSGVAEFRVVSNFDLSVQVSGGGNTATPPIPIVSPRVILSGLSSVASTDSTPPAPALLSQTGSISPDQPGVDRFLSSPGRANGPAYGSSVPSFPFDAQSESASNQFIAHIQISDFVYIEYGGTPLNGPDPNPLFSIEPMGGASKDPYDITVDDNGPPPAPLAAWFVYSLKSQLAQTDINAIDPEMTVLGSLMSIESNQGDLDLASSESSAGRGSGYGRSIVSTGLTTQVDLGRESNSDGWTSYVAIQGWTAPAVQPPVAGTDVVQNADELDTEPIAPASITAGEAPLGALLSGSDVPIPTDSDRLEQVAELIPSQESSLALVATLWTVSSDAPTPAIDPDTQANRSGRESGTPEGSPASWTVFVTGLNEAIEQSQRDVEEMVHSDFSRSNVMLNASGVLEDRLPWQGPILPATKSELPDRVRPGSRPGHSTVPEDRNQPREANEASSLTSSAAIAGESNDDCGHEGDVTARSDDGRDVVLASLPTVSAVSALGAISGWLWTQRKRWFGSRSGEYHRQSLSAPTPAGKAR